MSQLFEVAPLGDRRGHRVVGEIDAMSAEQLSAAFDRDHGGSAAGSGSVYLDLSEVSFIDSAGCRALLVLAQGREDGTPLIVVPSHVVARTLELMRIDTHPKIRVEPIDVAS